MACDIDFVITWVDSNDPKWLKEIGEYYKYSQHKTSDVSEVRYRDWGFLRYWFRGVEKFAPWVRYIHFVTYGHIPEWLDTSNPKLRIVRHEDYIPKAYLPLFNSNAIEIMMHKIPDLAEHFVYFNDDFFLTKHVSPDYFFHKGIPCDMAVISITTAKTIMREITEHNMSIIRQEFDVFASVMRHPRLWFYPGYGKFLLNTVQGIIRHTFINPGDTHAPQPYKKSTWKKVWSRHHEVLTETLKHKFRTPDDNSHWLYRYWQIMEGKIYPRNIIRTTKVYYDTCRNINHLCASIEEQTYNVIVINDTPETTDLGLIIKRIEKSFKKICPEKSTFEK